MLATKMHIPKILIHNDSIIIVSAVNGKMTIRRGIKILLKILGLFY